jgi:predicted esterase
LLFTAGSEDNIIPAHLNKRNFKKYKRNGSILEYKEFAGRNHFVLGQSIWKEDAEFILEWINKL